MKTLKILYLSIELFGRRILRQQGKTLRDSSDFERQHVKTVQLASCDQRKKAGLRYVKIVMKAKTERVPVAKRSCPQSVKDGRYCAMNVTHIPKLREDLVNSQFLKIMSESTGLATLDGRHCCPFSRFLEARPANHSVTLECPRGIETLAEGLPGCPDEEYIWSRPGYFIQVSNLYLDLSERCYDHSLLGRKTTRIKFWRLEASFPLQS